MGATPNRILWLDYLRSALTVLVVAHHASLAYTTFAAFHPEAYILSTHPVVDTHRWIGMDIFENFNDVFFMSLMFFISGIFALPALRKKGVAAFLRDRFYRLFIPFVAAVSLLMLIAYYPAYYLAHHQHHIKAYIIDFFTIEQWPVGPPWFIWVLFAFNLLLALLYPLVGGLLTKAGAWLSGLQNKPGGLFLFFFLATFLLYVPLAMAVGSGTWTGFYPFDFQLSRVVLYFGYFILGAVAGSIDLGKGLFADTSVLKLKWPVWTVLCVVMYVLLTIVPDTLTSLVQSKHLAEPPAWLLYFAMYTASCTASCLAFLSMFKAGILSPKPAMQSLTANAYGIYLVHYIFVVWCQYLLLPLPLHAVIKFSITFIIALALSWLTTSLLRKINTTRKYI
ncbi:acyltransferase [Paraflavitalea soli]|uniref:Acyltransferase n=1 Tax=Paraflavitalea soli TaxID=2315862 RepID=A0A3B7MHG7_9BACT|nr:acyltransferase [Paraflavitalea soli]AXY72526.1 acyltransferase [Paraflavitalea soli]